jgi:hypothetical protein
LKEKRRSKLLDALGAISKSHSGLLRLQKDNKSRKNSLGEEKKA